MVREIPLTKGYVALVDDEDFERVNAFKWTTYLRKRVDGSVIVYGYRLTPRDENGSRRSIYLHRFILSAPDGVDVDHINGDGLNCTRSNMRIATRSQNLGNQRAKGTNTSGFKGVRRHKGRWMAQIGHDWQKHYLGRYDDPAFAAAVYDAAARHFFGPFALTNFPEPNPDAEAIIAARFAERMAA